MRDAGNTYDDFARQQAFVDVIEKLDAGDHAGVLAAVADRRIDVADFMELDERPGQYEGDYNRLTWHTKLRQVRNTAGNTLFEYLAANAGVAMP